ncbi:fasciclin domain-containing protein [Tamlana crocina]|uniref:fasciclin domain-containing protein n=1 Tax=Tamlana crocina TaxID=393006 RepID=UPI001FD8240C|nr:fasciclin domain-containing protein [Tamlana crocina]
MNTLKTISKIASFVMIMFFMTSCNDDDDNNNMQPSLNIVQTAQTSSQLSILVDAVVQAGLVDALSASGNKTVLAPTNAAFTAFLQDKGFNSLSDVPNDVLTQILLNHVIADTNIYSASLVNTSGYTNTMAEGPNNSNLSLYFDGSSGVTFNGMSSVQIADIETSNGVVHVVDKVIDLPTIATFATTNSNLSILVDALAYADTGNPTVPYINTVSDGEAGPFTVFAPTNDAFASLLAELNVSALTDIDTETVDAVLLNHIVNANVQSSMLTSGTVSTLGGDITADANAFTLTDANGRMSNIVTSLLDIQGTNGVVHVIDKVILPEAEEPNIVETAQSVADLSILVDAVVKANLVGALSAEGNRTVLAPTNAAFTAFLNEKGFNSLADVPNDVLTQILLNHVIPDANIMSSDLAGAMGYTNTMAGGPNNSKLSIYFDGSAGVMFNGSATVTTADVSTSNGVVHIVDKVIDLPTIATFATSNAALSILVDALAYADTGTPTVPYIETVSNPEAGPFTVFAPTNDAFASLLTELEVSALTDIPTSTVNSVLLHHIVNANVQSSQLATGTVTTLGGDIQADASAFTLTDANGRTSNIVTSLVDIQASNGVVHVIDKVILPPL